MKADSNYQVFGIGSSFEQCIGFIPACICQLKFATSSIISARPAKFPIKFEFIESNRPRQYFNDSLGRVTVTEWILGNRHCPVLNFIGQ